MSFLAKQQRHDNTLEGGGGGGGEDLADQEDLYQDEENLLKNDISAKCNHNHSSLIESNPTKKQIQIDDFQLELNHNLIKFRAENLFTDIFIYVEGVEFPCHKVILCAASSYFKAMFSCDLKESRLGKVYIDNISSWTMKHLLDFIYTGKIEINYENVIDIFNAAAMFQLYKLADKCTDYIEEHIDLSNCIEIHVFASMHQLVKLEKDTFQFILDNFMQLINSPPTIPISIKQPKLVNNTSMFITTTLDEINATNQLLNCVISTNHNDIVYFSDFVLLSEQNFQSLIRSDLLNVSKEIYVYYAIKKWIEYHILLNNAQKTTNNLKIMKTYENLFKHVRLNALSQDELEFISTNDKLIHSNQNLLNHLNNFLINKTKNSQQANEHDNISTNINTANATTYNIAASNNDNKVQIDESLKLANSQIEVNSVKETTSNVNVASATEASNCVRPSTIPREYLCLLKSNQFQFYDFYKSKWDCLSSWPPPFYNSKSIGSNNNNTLFLSHISREDISLTFNGYSTCIVNNILYVIGGYLNRFDLVDNVWRFDPIKNEWSTCRPMLNKRAFHLSISLTGTSSPSSSSSLVTKANNFIFLFYGICYANNTNDTVRPIMINNGTAMLTQCLSIDFYNIDTDQWTILNTSNNNSLLNHHIFQTINIQNRNINNHAVEEHQEQEQLETNSVLNQLINHQLAQSKTIVSLKNLIYILKENCINCYEFNSDTEQLTCLPYFRLPANLSSFSLATAFSIKITSSGYSSSNTLFSWYSDNEDSSSSSSMLSSPQATHSNKNIETMLNKSSNNDNSLENISGTNNNNKDDDLSDDNNETRTNNSNEFMRSKKEALIYLINPQKRILYEFYPAKNKLKKLPNLILDHSSNETYVLSIKSKLYVTGGYFETNQVLHDNDTTTTSTTTNNNNNNNEENSNAIEILNEDKDNWSLFKNNLAFVPNNIDNQSVQMTKHFFKLKMSLNV